MANRDVPFGRAYDPRPRRGRGKAHLRRLPWIPAPLALLVLVSGAIWVVAEFNLGSRVGLLPQTGPGMSQSGAATHAGLRFRECGGPAGSRYNCVVDGDTIYLEGTKVRLADIDAPEIFSPQCRSEARRGERATARLTQLLNAGPFEAVGDYGNRDRYGRQLRVIARDGQSIGDMLVAEGLARPWSGARRSWC